MAVLIAPIVETCHAAASLLSKTPSVSAAVPNKVALAGLAFIKFKFEKPTVPTDPAESN